MLDKCENDPCGEALENPKRIGRAAFVCSVCEKDISLAVLLYEETKQNNDLHWSAGGGTMGTAGLILGPQIG